MGTFTGYLGELHIPDERRSEFVVRIRRLLSHSCTAATLLTRNRDYILTIFFLIYN